jgi:hypothetical protein
MLPLLWARIDQVGDLLDELCDVTAVVYVPRAQLRTSTVDSVGEPSQPPALMLHDALGSGG